MYGNVLHPLPQNFNILPYHKRIKNICSVLDENVFKRVLLDLQIKEVEEILDNVKIEMRKLVENCLALLN